MERLWRQYTACGLKAGGQRMTGLSSPPRRLSLWEDIYCGAVRGDFADGYMGVAGRVTQALVAFVPIIGQVCAARDFIADRRQKDYFGAFVNVLIFFGPFIGGFAKVILVFRSIRHVPRLMNSSSSQTPPLQPQRTPPPRRR
jgi:hypothetical protein